MKLCKRHFLLEMANKNDASTHFLFLRGVSFYPKKVYLHQNNKGGKVMNQTTIGKFIAQKRKEKNLTQEQLAEKLSVSNKTISKWETGKCMPDYSIIESLCKELNITISELMDGEEQEEKSIRMYDEEQIMDLIERSQKLQRHKGVLIGLLYISISASIGRMAEFFNWSSFAEIISISITVASVVVAFIGVCFAIKSMKN